MICQNPERSFARSTGVLLFFAVSMIFAACQKTVAPSPGTAATSAENSASTTNEAAVLETASPAIDSAIVEASLQTVFRYMIPEAGKLATSIWTDVDLRKVFKLPCGVPTEINFKATRTDADGATVSYDYQTSNLMLCHGEKDPYHSYDSNFMSVKGKSHYSGKFSSFSDSTLGHLIIADFGGPTLGQPYYFISNDFYRFATDTMKTGTKQIFTTKTLFVLDALPLLTSSVNIEQYQLLPGGSFNFYVNGKVGGQPFKLSAYAQVDFGRKIHIYLSNGKEYITSY